MDDDALDTLGRALGFALAVYDQTTPGAQLDRIVETRRTLDAWIDDERFSPDVSAVMEGVTAGLTSYVGMVVADQTGTPRFGKYLL
ncbi:hypothetical protein [Comamonas antarctica]|uniref:Uncharacterized protein n=1 Tax=Comamonas antarctica TaxID=2743470 RepID=A0A6N1WZX1_9BURK|nr:hypothetical protein [Comamonas antarctica]QKV52631.1 hypothetical protein HUK68_06780 [Comamonas antarctica]